MSSTRRLRRIAIVVILFGVTSLLGDMTYEGFRSTIPFLVKAAGGGGLELGEVIGLGEALNWILRIATGFLADLLRAYWAITLLGYMLTPLGVAIAVSTASLTAIALGVAIERLGKAVRTPARDALLSRLSEKSYGLIFGIHELLDQVGAILGPFYAFVLVMEGTSLVWLALPGLFTALSLGLAYLFYPREAKPIMLAEEKRRLGLKDIKLMVRIIAIAIASSAPILHPVIVVYGGQILYSMGGESILLYLVAMLADALAAIPLGLAWDKLGPRSLLIAPIIGFSSLPAIIVSPWVSAVLSGSGVAGLETVLRAYVARTVPSDQRATAYGALALGIGVGMALAALAYPLLIDRIAQA